MNNYSQDPPGPPGEELGWNTDSSWLEFIESLTPIIEAIAAKYTEDIALREDAVQNAKIELLHQYPEEIRGYEDYILGNIDNNRWQEILKSYCLTIVRNQVITTLSSYTTGNLYIGRSQVVKVEEEGEVKEVRKHLAPRYISLDQLVEDSGLQITDTGELSWDMNLQEERENAEDT